MPTGFADLGPAEYATPNGSSDLLVESVQSMANRLELSVWDPAANSFMSQLSELPFVSLDHPKHGLVTSVMDPHRLGSAYLFPALQPLLLKALGPTERGQFPLQTLARELFRLDPNAVIHGVFFPKLQPVSSLPRLLSGFIDAKGVNPVLSTGVKFDRLDPSGPAAQVKGNILYARREYTAQTLVAYFNFDLQRLRCYGLSEDAQSMLVALGLLKVRRFLSEGLRLRSQCDLEVVETRFTRPDGFVLPTESSLLELLQPLISKLRSRGELGKPLTLKG